MSDSFQNQEIEHGGSYASLSSISSNAKVSRAPPDDSIVSENGGSKLNLRMEIMMRKEKMRQEEEAQYTFKPTTSSATKPAKAGDSGAKENRFDKLYSDALKRHIVGQLKDEVYEDGKPKEKDLTFIPKISSKAARLSRSSSRDRLGISQPGSREPSRGRGESEEKSSRGRSPGPHISQSNADYFKELTFKPSITKRAKDKSVDKQDQKEVSQRLYEQIFTKKEKLDQLAAEYVQRSLEECTFSPHLPAHKNKPISGLSTLDVTERMSRFEEFRKKKLEVAIQQREQEDAEELTFKPSFYHAKKRSQSPSVNNNSSNNINGTNPMLEANTPTSSHKVPHYAESRSASPLPVSSRKHNAVEEMYAELTFQPKIVSKRSASASPSGRSDNGGYANVHERLFHQGVERKRELEVEQEKKRAEMSMDLTFQPHIKGHAEKIVADGKLFERLSMLHKEETPHIAQWKTELEKELTFKPSLPTSSKEIAAKKRDTTPLYDRALAEQERLRKEAAKKLEEQQAEELKGATFKPLLPKRSSFISDQRRSLSAEPRDGNGVFRRLSSTLTMSTNMSAAESVMTDDVSVALVPGIGFSRRKSVVLPERNIQQLFERLHSTVKIVEEAKPEAKVKIMDDKGVNQVVERLTTKRTKSYAVKVDPEELERIQPKHVKELKVEAKQLNEIVERLGSKTTKSRAASISAGLPKALLGTKPMDSNAESPIIRRSESTDRLNMTQSSTPFSTAANKTAGNISPPPAMLLKKVFKDVDANSGDSPQPSPKAVTKRAPSPAAAPMVSKRAASPATGESSSAVKRPASAVKPATAAKPITSASKKRGESQEREVIVKVPVVRSIKRAPKEEAMEESEAVAALTFEPPAVVAPQPAATSNAVPMVNEPVKFDRQASTAGKPSNDFERKLAASLAMLTMPVPGVPLAASVPSSTPVAVAPPPANPVPATQVIAPVVEVPTAPTVTTTANKQTISITEPVIIAPAPAPLVPTDDIDPTSSFYLSADPSARESPADQLAFFASTAVTPKAAAVIVEKESGVSAAAESVVVPEVAAPRARIVKPSTVDTSKKESTSAKSTPRKIGAAIPAGVKKTPKKSDMPPLSAEAKEFMDSIPMVDVEEGSATSGM